MRLPDRTASIPSAPIPRAATLGASRRSSASQTQSDRISSRWLRFANPVSTCIAAASRAHLLTAGKSTLTPLSSKWCGTPHCRTLMSRNGQMVASRPMTYADTDSVCGIMAVCYRVIAGPDQITETDLQRLAEECCSLAHVTTFQNADKQSATIRL